MDHDQTPGGVAFVRDDHAQFFYTIPDGWHRVTEETGGSGPTSAIASTDADDPDEQRKASVLAGVMRDLPGGSDDLAQAALFLARGWAQLSDSKANAVYSEETSRSFTIDGHPAATASLRADFPESDSGSLYLRMTIVEVVETYFSYLAGTAHPEAVDLRAAIDGVHQDLIVVMGS
ncbi:hypothetical protein AB0I28_33250 [Phytomonospora sp. NPDC050363]|uniref:hypothetical protein n=1 Tax=Phytomonospora sp. NPDC050363 TaxID=3155642 RepID=UPI0033F8B85B